MIVVAGKNDIAVWGLQKLIALVGRDNLAVVTNRTDDGVNRWQKSLRFFSGVWGVEQITLAQAEAEAELFLSLEFDQLIRPGAFSTAQLFNVHFSLLPKYRGMFTSTWPILNDEISSGVTLHVIDEGIDTGPIIDQQSFSINPKATARDLYLDCIKNAICLLERNLIEILKGRCISVEQSRDGASYYSKKSLNFSQAEIDLDRPAREVLNFVRAFCFREYQLPCFLGREVVRAQMVSPGTQEDIRCATGSSDQHEVVGTFDHPVKLYFDRLDDFHRACEGDDLLLVTRFFNNIVSVDDKDERGITPLMTAVGTTLLTLLSFYWLRELM
jgi:methionyl-tRNA formyltransferase